MSEEIHEVTADDLPLCCPRSDAPIWNAHPRVYIPIETEATCPYCGATFVLVESSA